MSAVSSIAFLKDPVLFKYVAQLFDVCVVYLYDPMWSVVSPFGITFWFSLPYLANNCTFVTFACLSLLLQIIKRVFVSLEIMTRIVVRSQKLSLVCVGLVALCNETLTFAF